ncbi:MAG TPA: tetratricopeptide repeat protein [Polyangiaceae bacterium]
MAAQYNGKVRRWIFLVALASCVPLSPVDRALELSRQDRRSEAEELLRHEIAEHPDDVPARKLMVRLLGFDGDLGAAAHQVEELRAHVAKGDPSPEIELGHAYELAHKFDEALAQYDKAAAIAPDSPKGPLEGGMRCARWNEPEAAEPRLEEAIRRGARDADTYHALGIVKLHLRDFDGAERAYREGLRVDPSHDENMLGLATVALMREDPAAALAAYDALVKKHPGYAAGELGRAWALAKLGRKNEARAALDRAESLGAPKINVQKQRAALLSGSE